MIQKIAIACLTALSLSGSTLAQEFGIELNAGLQGLRYDISNGDRKLQPGGSLGVNYTFHLGRKWGLLTGVSASYFNTKVTLQDGTFSSYQVDNTGSAFQYNIKATGFEEKQSFLAGAVPLMLQYHTLGNTRWYVNAGAKLILPVEATVKAKASQLTLSGYYPDYNIEVKDMPQHGFGTVNNWTSETKQELKPAVMASAATGISFRLGEGVRLYTGVYFDYGVTNMNKGSGDNASLVAYNPANINEAKAGSLLNGIDKIHAMGYGIQVRLGLEKKKQKSTPPSPPPPVAEAPVKQEPVQVAVPPPPQPKEEVKQPKQDPEPTPAPTITTEEITVVEKPVVFSKIGNTTLSESFKPHLDSIATILNRYPDLRVDVIGHTCDIGTEKENARIGLERAKSVAKYLQSKGIAMSRMDLSSAGPSNPVVENTSAGNRSLNRRVTVMVK
ncbi:MAG: OmpA family protein [Pseudobacter sp.]|uniref:OmpA family protein n=1 Tax=Pseudobacter sp. TaxID=2045420 RepID=UPI003F8026BB